MKDYNVLKDFTIDELLCCVKQREREELETNLRQHGEKVDNGYEWHFEGECPIIAAYVNDNPEDIVVHAARLTEKGKMILLATDKECSSYEYEVIPDDVFAGHLDFVTAEIG